MPRYHRKSIAEINVVPYVDVMLVLLVIFMITTPLLTQGVSIDLPKAKSMTLSASKQPPLIVSVDHKGHYFLNTADDPTAPLTANKLAAIVAAELALAAEQHETRVVLVKGDKAVNYGAVIQAMAILQQAGADKVGLMTEPFPTQAANRVRA